jgi:hypothetical protein
MSCGIAWSCAVSGSWRKAENEDPPGGVSGIEGRRLWICTTATNSLDVVMGARSPSTRVEGGCRRDGSACASNDAQLSFSLGAVVSPAAPAVSLTAQGLSLQRVSGYPGPGERTWPQRLVGHPRSTAFSPGRLVRLPLTRISCGPRPGRSRYPPTLVRLQIAGQLPVWGGGGAGLFPCSEQMRIAEWKSGWVAREA